MFKSKSDKQMAKQTDYSSPDKLNRIVEGTRIEGTVSSDSNIRIDGEVKGNVQTKGRLVIGPNGKIKGEVTCQNAEVEGSVNGKIMVEDLLSLKSSARLDGEIFTSKLAIDPGATFTGSCHMGSKVKQITHEGGQEQLRENREIKEKTA
jgi:cytoskeletal protein CcmA (bactofilin family)